MAVVATNLKKGQCIRYNNELSIVLATDHRTPGKGNAKPRACAGESVSSPSRRSGEVGVNQPLLPGVTA